MMTELLTTSSGPELAAAVSKAAELLTRGEPVALPTETVYGLAADALSSAAVLKIFEAKARPFFDPLIVHLPNRDWLNRLTLTQSPLVLALIEKFWPGPLTLVLPRRELVPDLVAAGLSTVAVRMSAHPVFCAVIDHFGRPLAAPSANPFGRISPTTALHVLDGLGGRIPLVVDGGPAQIGIESTIVAVEGDELRVLRAGPVTPEELAAFAPVVVGIAGAKPEAAGQLKSHYAPKTPLRLIPQGGLLSLPAGARIGLLAWRDAPHSHRFSHVEILSATGDLREAAATLFSKLRRLDAAGLDFIFADPVPEWGLGLAIMDRLGKAAADV